MRLKAGHGPITPQTEDPTPYCVQWSLNWAAVKAESFSNVAVKRPVPSLYTRGRVPASLVQSGFLL